MRKKYLVILLVLLTISLAGCRKKDFAPPPVPFAPSNLTATTVSPNEINLNWKDNSTTENGFYIYRKITGNYARVAIMETNATSYNDTGLSPETTYWYKVTAYNDGGESGSSNEVSVTTPPGSLPPLEAPSNLSASVISYKQINLSWQDNSTTEDGFRVRCNIGHTQTNTIATVGPNTTRYEHCKLQPMTDHKYYIEAFRGEETAGTPQVSATTFAAPVEILEYWLVRSSMRMFHLGGELKSEATEPCSVELRAEYYITPIYPEDYPDGYEEWDTCTYTVDLEALTDSTFFEFIYILGTETAGDKVVTCEKLEIIDVEIEY